MLSGASGRQLSRGVERHGEKTPAPTCFPELEVLIFNCSDLMGGGSSLRLLQAVRRSALVTSLARGRRAGRAFSSPSPVVGHERCVTLDIQDVKGNCNLFMVAWCYQALHMK